MADTTATENPAKEKSFFARAWDKAADFGNKALLVREGVIQSIAGIPAIPGYIADLADKGAEALGGDLYEGSAGGWIQERARNAMRTLDPLHWAGIEGRIQNESDQALVDNVELGTDVVAAIATLGAGSVKLVGTAGKVTGKASKFADDAAKVAARSADDVAETAVKASDDVAKVATKTSDDIAAPAVKAEPVKQAAKTADDTVQATARAADDVTERVVKSNPPAAKPTGAWGDRFAKTHMTMWGVGGATIAAAAADAGAGSPVATKLGRIAASDAWYAPLADAGLWTLGKGLTILSTAYAAIPTFGAAATIGALEERGHLDKNSPDYRVKTQIIHASTQALAGNISGVADHLAGTGIRAEYVVDAYRQAREQAPGDEVEQSRLALNILSKEIRTRAASNEYGLAGDAYDASRDLAARANEKIQESVGPGSRLQQSLGTTFGAARERAGEAAQDAGDATQNWLMSNPFFAAIATFFKFIGDLLKGIFGPMLDAANGNNLIVQGDPGRVARVMHQNGYAPAAGAKAQRVSHDGHEQDELVLDPALAAGTRDTAPRPEAR